MANAKPEVEWLYDPNVWQRIGVTCLAGKWAGVREDVDESELEIITPWVDDRQTAIGFLKLLKENENEY